MSDPVPLRGELLTVVAALVAVAAVGCAPEDAPAQGSSSGGAVPGSTGAGASTGAADRSTTSGTTGTTAALGDSADSGGTTSTGQQGSTSDGVNEDCTVVIAEVVFDPEGAADDQLQWVKLKNLCSFAVELSTWTIGYGGPHYGDNRQKQLDAPDGEPGVDTVIPAFGCFIVGGPVSSADNGSPVYNLPEDFAPGLSYDRGLGSGVALFDVPAAGVDAETIPVDAVIYGPNNDAGLIDETGNAVGAPHVGLPPPGGSISRTGAGPQWDQNVDPQPALCPTF